LVFGKDQNKGIRLRVLKPVIVNLDEGVNEKELLIHDQFCEDSTLANLLSGFDYPGFPVPMGILRQVEYTPYEEKIEQQIKTQIEKKGVGDLAALLRVNQVWKN
jgi:2-oxoglutarate ferredoxin oxidoreductase subunit beta